jgi:hypothetical protein
MKLKYHHEIKPYENSDRVQLIVKQCYKKFGDLEHGNLTVYPEWLEKELDREREQYHQEWLNNLPPIEKELYDILSYDLEQQINKELFYQLHQTANVRFRWLKNIFTSSCEVNMKKIFSKIRRIYVLYNKRRTAKIN